MRSTISLGFTESVFLTFSIFETFQPAHPNNDMPVGPFGTPVPCFHCYLAKAEEEEEEERWAFIKEDPSSSSPSRSKSGDDSDIFVTAGKISILSPNVMKLFGNCLPR